MSVGLAKKVQAFVCSECTTAWDTKIEAAACCPDELEETVSFFCSNCGGEFRSVDFDESSQTAERLAKACCVEAEPDVLCFACPNCGNEFWVSDHYDADDAIAAARACCADMAKGVTKYGCPKCGEWYENDVKARECCFGCPVARFECPRCTEWYETEKEAALCCR